MGWYSAVNQHGITAGGALYQLMVALVAAGWTAKGSGDGTGGHYSATDGTAVTSGLHAANGFLNTGSWMRLQSPVTANGQKREFVFQQGAGAAGSTVTIRIKYSPNPTGATGFTGGSPSASRVPSATDEVILSGAGGGTDAAPTYNSWGSNNDYTFTFHVVADNDGDDGYSWYCFQTISGQGNFSNSMGMALDVLKLGTVRPGDADPCVVYWNGACNFGSHLYGSTSTNAFVGGTAAADFVPVFLHNFVSSGLPPASLMGTDATSNLDQAILLAWVRFPATPTQPGNTVKGYSSLFQAHLGNRGNVYPLQNNPNAVGDRLFNANTNGTWGTTVPWPAKTPCFVN